MEKIQQYRTALDAAVYIRQFMFSENHYFRVLDDALQPFIDAVQASISDMIPRPKSESNEKND